MTQTKIDTPTQNNYTRILQKTNEIQDEVFWLRHAYEDQVNQIYDLSELIGRLAAKIEEWVGVAEE